MSMPGVPATVLRTLPLAKPSPGGLDARPTDEDATKGTVRMMGRAEAQRSRGPVTRGDVAQAEMVTLAQAVEDMAEWITMLPASSEWSWAFRRMRAQLVADLDLLAHE